MGNYEQSNPPSEPSFINRGGIILTRADGRIEMPSSEEECKQASLSDEISMMGEYTAANDGPTGRGATTRFLGIECQTASMDLWQDSAVKGTFLNRLHAAEAKREPMLRVRKVPWSREQFANHIGLKRANSEVLDTQAVGVSFPHDQVCRNCQRGEGP